MYVESPSRTYQAKDGSTRTYRTHLLRRSFRENGKVKKETLANLSALPGNAIAALKASLSGSVLADAGDMFEIERSLPHGHVAAAHVMASRVGLKNLLGPDCPDRDLAYGLIIARAVAPASKLATTRWWADTTLGTDLGIDGASTDEVYAAMDWLVSRQNAIEKKLAARHLETGGLALFDLSSAWLEGHSCPLGAFGHSRDGKKSREQIEFGMVTSRAGIPVAIRVFAGNTSDSVAFGEIIPVVRDKFGLGEVILVGDRGSVTQVRIRQLKALPGAGWITALRAPSIAALARDDGPLQMSLSGDQNFAEITDARYPGERLICCRNPALAAQRESLLAATETELEKIAAQVAAARLKGAGKIGVKVGKVINKRKVGKHFITDIADGRLSWRRDQGKIAAEAELDGIYVIRTSAAEEKWRPATSVDSDHTRITGHRRNPMVTKYQKFADGYKAEAVKLYRESNQTIAETARNLGLKESTLANWVKKDKDNEAVAAGEAPLTPAERTRIRDLEADVRRLNMENAFLKKASAYFASQNL